MKYVLRKGFPGGRNATAAAQIVILLSDGRSQGNVLQAAAELKETGVVLFAVGLRYPRYGGLLPSENDSCNNNAKKTPTIPVCSAVCEKEFCFQVGGATRSGQ